MSTGTDTRLKSTTQRQKTNGHLSGVKKKDRNLQETSLPEG